MQSTRRDFLKHLGLTTAGFGLLTSLPAEAQWLNPAKKMFFDISLAEWSLHRTLQAGKLTNMDFPAKAKNEFGIRAVEYVDQFFKDKANDRQYLGELKKRADDLGVRNVLIMVDTAGPLADPDDARRKQGVESHYQWVDAAKFLGCHSIRVNLRGKGSAEDIARASIDGLGRLAEYGAKNKIGIIVENHGGYSSDGKWLTHVIRQINNPYAGTLPDFDNFKLNDTEVYDRYLGVAEMMPFAKGVSAKSRDFDAQGNETTIDYPRMLQLVKRDKTAAFNGFIGIEYSGNRLSEDEGIHATKQLLERAGQLVS